MGGDWKSIKSRTKSLLNSRGSSKFCKWPWAVSLRRLRWLQTNSSWTGANRHNGLLPPKLLWLRTFPAVLQSFGVFLSMAHYYNVLGAIRRLLSQTVNFWFTGQAWGWKSTHDPIDWPFLWWFQWNGHVWRVSLSLWRFHSPSVALFCTDSSREPRQLQSWHKSTALPPL